MGTIAPWASEHETQWLAALMALQAAGWHAELTCLAAPVQVEGRLPSGELFYFRARHDEVWLAIGGADPADGAPWERSQPHPEASYLPASDGLPILRRLAQMYNDECGSVQH